MTAWNERNEKLQSSECKNTDSFGVLECQNKKEYMCVL